MEGSSPSTPCTPEQGDVQRAGWIGHGWGEWLPALPSHSPAQHRPGGTGSFMPGSKVPLGLCPGRGHAIPVGRPLWGAAMSSPPLRPELQGAVLPRPALFGKTLTKVAAQGSWVNIGFGDRWKKC